MPNNMIGALIGAGLALAWMRFGFLGMLFVILAAAGGYAIERYLWPRRAALMAFFQNGAENRRREVR
ncbi:DUF2273 domain-containing protein [Lacticaseibacillus camelliae]|uniref:DUF2273 domain-containing protein n=1 Tax=Lacticaseibacillus camelliae DSM 22697 = JCM 13995 TaxID=1423730 RepID=A0A0R2F5L4_9LACO|nr:DUF2273 domain-containing protein [Lacticaseibacillus camelliae]KRN23539.1 hypothetical protein FC75_GL001393 [Lacticaseibacillus camelliae DSM 22697 = JCM 13995]